MKRNFPLSTFISFILFVAFILSMSSCNMYMEKRRYRKGYFVSHIGRTNHGTEVKTNPVQVNKSSAVNVPITSNNKVKQQKSVDLVSEPSKVKVHSDRETPKKINRRIQNAPSFIKAGECDILFLKDGTTIEILVTSINEKNVTYKKCNYPDGPSYELSMDKVESIEYKNGEIYRPVPVNQPPPPDKNSDGRMITALVFGIISLICVIVSFVLLGVFGGGIPFGYGFAAALPLFIAGPFSLAGLIMSGKYARNGSHPLGKVAFYLNLIAQILAIIALILCFIPF